MLVRELILDVLSTGLHGYVGVPVLGDEGFEREVALTLSSFGVKDCLLDLDLGLPFVFSRVLSK
jgi:hypothetical protein